MVYACLQASDGNSLFLPYVMTLYVMTPYVMTPYVMTLYVMTLYVMTEEKDREPDM